MLLITLLWIGYLHETSKKVNSVERLTRHLNKGIPSAALSTKGNTMMLATNKTTRSREDVINAQKYIVPDGGLRNISAITEKNIFTKSGSGEAY